MLYPDHLRRFIIIPALAALPEAMRTEAAVELLLGTALKESRLTYLKQGYRQSGDGQGVALGLYQMETATHQDHLRYLERLPHVAAIIAPHGPRPATDMIWDLYYATRMARIHYWRVRVKLPEVNDVDGMARFWGRYYQTQSIPEQIEAFIKLYRQYAGRS